MLELVGGGGVRLLVDPEHGGRIVSLRHDDREWLAPSSPAPAGSTRFVHPGTGGWDEVLPTVASSGGLPDHGDLWLTAWEVIVATPTTLGLRTRSASSGVVLERTITATGDGVELSYRASTDAETDQRFLWSAHPLVAAAPGMTFDIPGAGLLVEEYPTAGVRRAAPSPMWVADAGTSRSAVKAFLRSEDLAASRTRSRVVSASIVDDDGSRLTLSWHPDDIPWLGLYWDTGEFTRTPVLALEPTSAGTDHADRDGRPWSVRRDRPRAWSVRVSASRR